MEPRVSCYFGVLYNVAVTINSSLDTLEVLKTVAESTALAMGAKGCAIMLLSPDGRELRHTVDYGLSDRYLKKGPVMVDRSMVDALKGRSVAVMDVSTDPRVQYGPQAVEEGISSILSVPVRLRAKIIGVLRIYISEARDFTIEDIELAEAVANLGAIALENARRHEEMKNDFDEVSRYIYNIPPHAQVPILNSTLANGG